MALYWVFTERCDGSAFTVSGCCSAAVIARADFHSGPYDTWAAAATVRNGINNPKPKPITADDLRVGQTWEWSDGTTRKIRALNGSQIEYDIEPSGLPRQKNITRGFLDLVNRAGAKLIRSEPQPSQPAPSIWTDLDVRTAANAAANEISKAGLTKLSVLEISERIYDAYRGSLVGETHTGCEFIGNLPSYRFGDLHPPSNEMKCREITANALNAQAGLIKSRGAQTVELSVKKPFVGRLGTPEYVLKSDLIAVQAPLDQTMAERDRLKGDYQQSLAELGVVREHRDRIFHELADTKQELTKARKELAGVRTAVSSVWTDIPGDLANQVRALAASRIQIREECNQARKELEETKKELERVRESHSKDIERVSNARQALLSSGPVCYRIGNALDHLERIPPF